MDIRFRHIALLVMTALMMVACSHSSDSTSGGEEPVPEPVPVAVGFSAFIADDATSDGTTRSAGGGELTTTELREKGFGVYCWYTGTTDVAFSDSKETTPAAHISTYAQNMLMRNQKVVWDNTQWTYSPDKYWPLNSAEKLTFRAYAPYTDYLVTDAKGMPQLPVVVDAADYHNGTQHDPLWGTGRLVNPATSEYYPANPEPPAEPLYPDNKRYGTLYNNITYPMSGDWRDKPTAHTPADTRNGFIDWYFHHGMAKIVFYAKLSETGYTGPVKITKITLEHLYSRGLLDVSSPAEINVGDSDPVNPVTIIDKPIWSDRAGDMTVELNGYVEDAEGNEDTDAEDLDAFEIDYDEDNDDNFTLLTNQGLLFIPRDFTSGDKLKLTVEFLTYEGRIASMSTEIEREFFGNTVYTFYMTVSNALSIEIDSIHAAFRTWAQRETDHEVYNW